MFSVGGQMETMEHKDKIKVNEVQMLLCDLVSCIQSGLQNFYSGHKGKIIKG